MKRSVRIALLAAAAGSLLAGCADGPNARGHRLDLGGPGERDRHYAEANPSAVIAAELGLASA